MSINSKIKVVVIGAGISGLGCASTLVKQNDLFEVTVLEARDRLGGRLDTRKFGSVTIDLGAMWMHKIEDNSLYDRREEIGIKLELTSDEQLQLDQETNDDIKQLDSPPIIDMHGNSLCKEGKIFFEEWQKIVKYVEDLYDELKDANGLVDKSIKDMSVIDKFHEIAKERGVDIKLKAQLGESLYNRFVNTSAALLSGYFGGELNRLSWKYLGFLNESGSDRYLMSGYKPIVDYLAKDLDVRLNCQVKKISYSNDNKPHRVIIDTTTGTYAADCVVVTVPLGCLKAQTIEFDPHLPERKQLAINRLGAGLIGKIAMRFKKRFWNKEFSWIKIVADENQIGLTGIRSFYSYTLQPILVAFFPPSLGKTLELRDEKEVLDETLDILSKYYGPEARDLYEEGFVTKWWTDPFSRGAYSYIEVDGTIEDYSAMSDPIFDDHVLFAGEHSTTSHPATVGGAYASGIREANRIVGKFKK